MTIDWISTLQEQAEFANQIADDVKQALEIPDLRAAEASGLYRAVEQSAHRHLIGSWRKWRAPTISTTTSGTALDR
jgi:hypothetical protein